MANRIKVSFRQSLGLIGPYVKTRLMEQVKSVALIIVYLIFFQTMILGIPVTNAAVIAVGLSLVIVGLTFFMEGLLLGLMPLGEVIGVKLPQKSGLVVILIFAFILGVGATYAEPAIGVLKEAGASVKAWEAPLLYLLLNKYSGILVIGVGGGVGFAVVFGMLRFIYQWSLKPFIYILISLLSGLTIWGFFDPNMRNLTGLAWDCGAVTTGPVTVPLVLALGIGISRIVSSGDSESGGFGVVTLASLFPILTVMLMGLAFKPQVPDPAPAAVFFGSAHAEKAQVLFESPEHTKGYALLNSAFNLESDKTSAEKKTAPPVAPIQALLGSEPAVLAYITELNQDTPEAKEKRRSVLGSEDGLKRWAALYGSEPQRLAVFGTADAVKQAVIEYTRSSGPALNGMEVITRQGLLAVRAILPLTLFLIIVLIVVLRERLQRPDEIIMGILFAVLGMGIFNVGIELGLTRIGNQVGGKLPSSFTTIELKDKKRPIKNFDPSLVQTAITEEGQSERFFYTREGNKYISIPFRERDLDGTTYTYTPTRGPLFGSEGGFTGILVVLIFAFLMGYGATLAEPALNALGLTVEEITVGTFRKSLLMQAVAIGVGLGLSLGVAKIIYGFPLVYMLVPPYMLLLYISWRSTEEFVNIGWDSAGVTTGPITVPLVLAMGLGIGNQVGVVEGFGILSMASVCPILSVLLVGLSVTKKRQAAIQAADKKSEGQVVS